VNLSDSIIPKSDQINAEDMLAGPRTVTIEKVTAGTAEQPVDVHLVEFPGRPYKPSKSMRRVMVGAWGPEASEYAGRRLTLFRNPATKFGGMAVGGIEISAMSHIEKNLTLALTVTRGKRAAFIVKPLIEVAPTPTEMTSEQIAACTNPDEFRAVWHGASTETRAQIQARVAAIKATPAPADDGPSDADWDLINAVGAS